jgi:hypothetical protein
MSAKSRHLEAYIRALGVLGLALLATAPVMAHTRITTDITWGDDIRAILRQHCMRCHSPGGIAPEYADFTMYGTDSQPGARAWATAIEEELLTGRMPPWQADARYDEYRNSRTLTPREIALITAWVEGGAPQGPRRDLPVPEELLADWLLGEPDLVVEPPVELVIPGDRQEEAVRVTLPIELEEDAWITAYEFDPDNARSVHRMAAYILDPEGETESLEVEVQMPYDPFRDEDEPEPTRWREMPEGRRFLGQWLRGDEPVLFPDLAGQRLRKGAKIELEIVYRRPDFAAGAEEIRDRSRLGLFLSRSEDEVEKIMESKSSAIRDLRITAKKATKKPATTAVTLDEDGHLFAVSPWVGDHVASLEVRAIFPDERERTLVWIPDYDPRWPASFVLEEPLPVEAGTRIELTGTFRRPEDRKKVAQAFELNVDYTLADHLVLPPPEIEPQQASGASRGGMFVDLFGQGLPDGAGPGKPAMAMGGDPNDPNAAAHMDHSPLHGGQFFMAANSYHHLEGALPEPGEFRLYVYDDFKQPVDPRNFGGRVVFEAFEEASGEFTETEYPLDPVAGTDYLVSTIPPELPAEFFASVWLAGEPTRFDFYFTQITEEPVGAPAGTRLTRAGPHSHERPPLTIPEQPQAIVGQILLRTEQLVEKIAIEDWLRIYIPAFDAKDLAEALLSRLEGLSARERGKVRRGISRIMQSTVEMERAGDLADEARLRRALERYRGGLDQIVEVYSAGGR